MTDETLTGLAGHLAATSSLNQVQSKRLIEISNYRKIDDIRKLSVSGYDENLIEFILLEHLDIASILDGTIGIKADVQGIFSVIESKTHHTPTFEHSLNKLRDSYVEIVVIHLMKLTTSLINWLNRQLIKLK